jgi:UDP-3-O-[3-hydroxymyristoyl] glucosamine N-acyltransferase
MSSFSLAELAEQLNARLVGDGAVLISSIAPLHRAKAGDISFLLSGSYKSYLANTQASAIVMSADYLDQYQGNALILDDPKIGYAKIATLFEKSTAPKSGIHPQAVVSSSALIDPSAYIGAHCMIGERVSVGARSSVGAGTVIEEDSSVGEDCWIAPNVSLYSKVCIKDRVRIHSGVVIGSDGFGLVNDRGKWLKIPQLGGVSIGSDVEIGANTTIDRGALDDTIIEDGVKLDNQIQIAHNVRIGAHTAIAGCVGIAGSTKIGKHCMIGGAAAIGDHLEITDQVIITGGTSVGHSITESGVYSSSLTAQPYQQWQRQVIRARHLDELFGRVKKLEKANND